MSGKTMHIFLRVMAAVLAVCLTGVPMISGTAILAVPAAASPAGVARPEHGCDGRGDAETPSVGDEDRARLETCPTSDSPPERAPGEPSKEASAAAARGERGPRDFLRLLDIDQSHFEKFVDGEPVGLDEGEVLATLLYAVRRPGAELVERWAKASGEFSWNDLAKQSSSRRGQFFHLRGRVKRVSEERPLPELADRLDLKKFYRCECEVEQRPFVVYAVHVPRAWAIDQPLDEPVGFHGMYFKLSAGGTENPTTPMFAAVRLAWHPDGLAGRMGFDYGLLEQVANFRDYRTAGDVEGLYQLLAGAAAVSSSELEDAAASEAQRMEPQQKPGDSPIPHIFDHARKVEALRKETRELDDLGEAADQVLALKRQERRIENAQERAAWEADLKEALADFQAKAGAVGVPVEVAADLAELDGWIGRRLTDAQAKLNELAQSPYAQGRPMTFEGVARRAVRVRVDDPALRERLGQDHYYSVVLFVDLGKRYKLEGGMHIRDTLIAAAVRELPPDMPQGDKIHEQVRLSGVFFKVIPYIPEGSVSGDPKDQLLAPLLVGRDLTWFPAQRANHYPMVILATVVLLLVLGGVLLWSWRTRRADAAARARLLRAAPTRGPDGSLDNLKIE